MVEDPRQASFAASIKALEGTLEYVLGSSNFFPDFSTDDIKLIKKVQPFTKTFPERVFALIRAVEYIITSNIPGDIVECGVWRGGSVMAITHTLLKLGDTNRDIYLFDTFEGMTQATPEDVSFLGEKAIDTLAQEPKDKDGVWSIWSYASIEQVKQLLQTTNYPMHKMHFVQGRVEDTIPAQAPERISLLRLDTDWYESTYHELTHLFPRLSLNGVLIIDDYGHWLGAKKATDEYIRENNIKIFLNRTDYSGRIGVKCFETAS
ncbi:MAG: class I SAM-dependent methyltransferase [Ktedonobacteraceae bacterium]|nr:class I SAM-dependent methyltransferase [Ktedonobacteraceae bacterium]